jgi:hypothetical protein
VTGRHSFRNVCRSNLYHAPESKSGLCPAKVALSVVLLSKEFVNERLHADFLALVRNAG